MGQHPYRGANISSASHEIPQNLQSTKIHKHILNSLTLLLMLSQINQEHDLPFCLFKVHCNITLYALQYIWHCINHKVLSDVCRLALGYECDRDFFDCICHSSNLVCISRLHQFTYQKTVMCL